MTTLILVQNVQNIFHTLSIGFLVYPKIAINSYIGKNTPAKSRTIFFKSYKSTAVISVAVFAIVYWGFGYLSNCGIFKSHDVKLLFDQTLLWSSINCAFSFHMSMMSMGLKSVQKQGYLIIANNLFIFVFIFSAWYWGVVKGYGVVGVIGSFAVARIIKLGLNIVVAFSLDWNSVGKYGASKKK